MTTSAASALDVPVAPIDIYARTGYASQAGTLVQNVSQTDTLWITFGASAPTVNKTGLMLPPGVAYSDKNGSANCWAQSMTGSGKVQVSKD